jgi:hypothetical protein
MRLLPLTSGIDEIAQLVAQLRQLTLLSQEAVDALGGHRIGGEMRHDPAVTPAVQRAVDKRVKVVIAHGREWIVGTHGYLTTRSRATAPCVMS